MKRTVVALTAFLLSTSVLAAETQRYLVATHRASRVGSLAAIKEAGVEPRAVSHLETFHGFAADLTSEEAAKLKASGAIRFLEPVIERRAFDVPRNPMIQVMPRGIAAIQAPGVWSAKALGAVNVVVIDTGIDYTHPELKNVYAGGWNIFTEKPDPRDDQGHGTHVSGTIAAADDGAGVVGVAPNVRLWSVKILDETGRGTSEGLLKALDWVSAQKKALGGNWVLNLSLGAEKESTGEREAFQKAADAGILIVAASGNEAGPLAYPAGYPSVFSVGATTANNGVAGFSNFGPELDIAAPGEDVLSTMPEGPNHLAYVVSGTQAFPGQTLVGASGGTVTAQYVYVGLGAPEDFPASLDLTGKIALIKRGGDITFADKTRRALAAGAKAVVIFNNVRPGVDPLGWKLINSAADQQFPWPLVVRIEMAEGEMLAAKKSGTITAAYVPDPYGEKSGTSMACPHVAGAAALLWTLAPNATPAQIINALTTTAYDLGDPGRDDKFGAGLLNVYDAARMLAPHTFGGITTGRPLGKRGR